MTTIKPCPTCGATGDEPCISKGGPRPSGAPTKRPHRGRVRSKEPAACGTYAGLQRHKRDGTPPCEDCRAAGSAYIRDWRNAAPGHREPDRRRRCARRRALARLGAEHSVELDRYLDEELARVGTVPLADTTVSVASALADTG